MKAPRSIHSQIRMGRFTSGPSRRRVQARNGKATQTAKAALLSMIQPAARDRWMTASAGQYTPERIDALLRGALTGDLTPSWQLFDLMEATWPELSKCLAELKGAVQDQDWNIQAWAGRGEDPSPEARRRADLLEDAIWNMHPMPDADENDFEGTIFDLMDAWGKGLALLEVDWEYREGRQGMLLAPRATRWVHPRYYGYPHDDARLMLNGREISQSRTATRTEGLLPVERDWIEIPQEKFLVGVAKQRSGHPAGTALLRPLAFWWVASNFTADWFLNFVQLFGVPIRWAQYAANASPAEIDIVCEMLANMGSAGWAALPEGTSLDLKEASSSGSNHPHERLLDRADQAAQKLILGQTLTTDVGDSGSRALGDVHNKVLAGRKRAATNFVVRVLNSQLIPAFCRLNFGDTKECPWFLPESQAQEDPKAMAERDALFLDRKIPMGEEWFYDRHGIPRPDPGDALVGQPIEDPNAQTGEEDPDQFRDATKKVEDGNEPMPKAVARVAARAAKARSGTDQLIDHVLENLTGVQARWLGDVKPFFEELLTAAQDKDLSDEDFIRTLESAQARLPELFDRINHGALEDALHDAMGAAVVNGGIQGWMRRQKRKGGRR